MKKIVEDWLAQALRALEAGGTLPPQAVVDVPVERSRDARHGDFASPVALLLGRLLGRKPREIAELIVAHLPSTQHIDKVAVAGPGFINFYVKPSAYQAQVGQILADGEAYGRSTQGAGRRVQVEFVSANPTGPLHVGHGRGASYGAAVAELLAAVGFEVHREYYVNDAGRQMDILATSIWLRYLDLCGEDVSFPANGYQGDYIWDIAADLHREHGDDFRAPGGAQALASEVPAGDDMEVRMDALIRAAKQILGLERYGCVVDLGLKVLVDHIRGDLEQFGVAMDEWFSERTLTRDGAVDRAIQRLREGGHVYRREGALWFRSTDFGDEKDRVVVRENGQATYFASDIAYHMTKFERGFDRLVDIWGADHHGYIARVKAAVQALGLDPSRLEVLLVQFANLYRSGQKVQMSTRGGEFVTLRELRTEVGNDAARFFYVMRKSDQHLDFDLDLAKSQSADNPVYYIQYAHARICSVLSQLKERGYRWTGDVGGADLALLEQPQELALLRTLSRYPETVNAAAASYEPHQLAFYLRELANDFHTYYNAHTFLVQEDGLRSARVALAAATGQVIRNGLKLLGVAAPESM